MTGTPGDGPGRSGRSPARPFDLLVVGSGVAGLTAALRVLDQAPGARVGVVAKADVSASATAWAQGGVAAVLDDSEVTLDARLGGDSADLHVADTLAAGAGLCDRSAVEVLTSGGPACVRHLVDLGAVFDRDRAGVLELAREGGHSVARVVHAGGAATGAEVQRCLVEAVRGSTAELWEGTFATDLLVEGGRCRGVWALGPGRETVELRATHTLLATGGAGQLFAVTTNPATSTADGVAMAVRAGVAVADLEFVQFHPTALHHPLSPRPLLSEALRGEGALLLDPVGQRFVDELAPRDVVSRAMTETMLAAGADHVWLDARAVPDLRERFSTLVAAVAAAGFDATAELLPVAPAAHYLCGGVLTDLDGATDLPGLWAAGEVACTGVHGANRLASNSLLEGLVFAARAVAAIVAGADGPHPTGALAPLLGGEDAPGSVPVDRLVSAMRPPVSPPQGGAPEDVGGISTDPDLAAALASLQRAMTVGAGVVRSAASLAETRRRIDGLAATPTPGRGAAEHELANLQTVAHALLTAAEAREETRGCHSRSEHPEAKERWRCRLVQGGWR